MSQKLLNRVFSAVAAFSLLVNSFSAPLAVYALDATDSAATQTQTLSETSTPTPTLTATPVPTDTPTETPTITATPTETQEEPSQGTVEADIALTQAITEEPATSYPEPDLSEAQTEGTSAELSPSVSTEFGDYAPTDPVLITGTGFIPNKTYDITISSSYDGFSVTNPPPSGQAKADDKGNIFYTYQLDGTYRPDYKVEIKNGDRLVASTSFTDTAYICQNDVEGANDEPGQKDLTKMCNDATSTPGFVLTNWNWDEISWSGNNTGDACNLFDTDGDGNINYAVCVTIGGAPAGIQSTSLYSCGDGKADRCTQQANLINPPYQSSCNVSPASDDPFPAGANYTSDTKGSCTVSLADVGGATNAHLVDVCSYPSQQPNSDPSDCIIATQAATGKLEVVKSLVPSNDTGLFDLSIDGPVLATGVGNGGTTHEQVVLAAAGSGTDHTFAEAGNGGTNLSDYTSSVVCKDNNGTGSVVSTTGSNPWTVNVKKDDDIVCTITNTLQQGTLSVIKNVINDNGGTLEADDFTFSVNGDTAIPFEADGQNDLAVDSGTYDVTEPTVAGYSTTYDNCTDVVVPAGGSATCTITNNDVQPLLTVTKIVINDNGGDLEVADFPLFVDSSSVTSGAQNGFNVGNYVVSETGQPGYTSVISGNCDSQGNVSLAVGDVKSCTITNNDVAPTLTLVKTVTNDNGGDLVVSDFPLFINGNPVTSGVANNLSANLLYTATETESFGYEPSGWGGDCTTGGTITLAPGDNKTCTITNDDIQPKLTVTKFVITDDGGNELISSFALYVGSTQVLSGVENGFDAGSYFVSEIELQGYTASDWGGACAADGSITLEVGGVYLCTITNDDEPASITLIKEVTNNNGGNAGVNDFGLTIGGTSVTSGQVLSVNSNTPYALDEAGLTGYTFVSLTGAGCPQSLGDTVTLNEGGSITCTITNDDEAPTITLVKNVINDNGGQAGPNDFGLTIGGNPTTSGTPVEVDANTLYELNEVGLPGYTFLSITGDPECPGLLGESTFINEGRDVTCTIINDDQTANLILVKHLPNDNGGDAIESDFAVYVDGNLSSWGSHPIDAGTYTISEATLPGYTPSVWSNDCSSDGEVTLGPGETKTCEITNDDEPATLTVIKVIEGSDYLDYDDFSFQVNGGEPIAFEGDGQNDETVPAGTYTVTEPTVDGYSTSYENCSGLVIPNGGSETCTITNTRDTGQIIIHKVIDQDGDWETDGDWLPGEDWEFDIDGITLDSSDPGTQTTDEFGDTSGVEVKTGEYDVIETVQPGWVLLMAVCGENGDFNQTDSVTGVSVGKDDTIECTFVNFLPQPALSTTKVRSDSTPDTILVGENAVMEITVENTGNVWLYNVGAYDYFDTDYVDFVSSNPTETTVVDDIGPDVLDYDGDGDTTEHIGIVTWSLGDMAPEVSQTIFATFVATAVTVDPVLAWNGAASFGCSEDVGICPQGEQFETELSYANVDVDELGLQIDKTNDKPSASTGDTVTYTLVVTNTGEGSFDSIKVTDNLPGGFSYVIGSTTINGSPALDPVISGGKLEWTVADPNLPLTITYKATIISDLAPGNYINYATCLGIFGRQGERECNIDDSTVSIGQGFSYGGQLTPQVLGAATELPATGSSTSLLLFALIVGGFGMFTKIRAYQIGRRKYGKN